MVWKQIRNKPLERLAFHWDGTEKCLHSHFTPEERREMRMRVLGEGRTRFVMIKTLHGPTCVKEGDWIVKVLWPSGIEVYGIKSQVFDTAYEIVGEVESE